MGNNIPIHCLIISPQYNIFVVIEIIFLEWLTNMIKRDNSNLEVILKKLAETANMPRNEAISLPPSVYVSEDILNLETENIFVGGWICLGRTEELQEPNSFVTMDIAGTPVIAVRQKDGSIQAFSNVCLHRVSKLVKERRGKAPRIVCPYHAWTYKPDGSLLAAPYMQDVPGFCVEGRALPKLRTEIWEGFIYVSLNPDIAPLGAGLQGLADVYGRYRMADFITFVHDDEVWNANWKVIVENFIEGYHLFRIHPETFEPVSPTVWQVPQQGGEAYMYQTSPVKQDSSFGVAPAGNDHLEGEWRHTGSVGCVFPSHLIQITPDFLWYMSLQPDGVGRTRVRRGIAVAPERLAIEQDHESFFAATKALFDKVNVEDRTANEAVQAGAGSLFADQGPLCTLEFHMHEFGQYLSRSLASDRGGGGDAQ